jgi:iron complex transport system permease protein
LCFVLDLALGSVRIPPLAVLKILFTHQAVEEGWNFIVLQIRLPKALTAMVVGSGLAVSGLQMQTLFRNPLAGPSVLGLSAGASLGVAVLRGACDGFGASAVGPRARQRGDAHCGHDAG